MSVLSILGMCMMAISAVAQINLDVKQNNTNPKPLTNDEHRSLTAQWAFCFSLGVLVFVIGLL